MRRGGLISLVLEGMTDHVVFAFTVKLIDKGHPKDQHYVVSIYSRSLGCLIAWNVYTWGPIKCGLCKQVVFIYRWSSE